ncbi:AimR family lysis-lysogeny pheromone receptor [Evansella sp. AB-rgal1]|uniref:AimR family lysis-lysogeny pheromone receptor n=1 Tax=Evansella sp. AB-rgal1 TaxID=3242696 RepID=UPI00359E898D
METQYSDEIFRSCSDIDHIIRDFEDDSYLARVSLEYAVSNSNTKLLEYLIDKLSNSDDVISQEWATIYQIDNLVCKHEMSLIESIDKLTHLQCQSAEMSVLRKIFQLYNYHDLKAFQMIEILSELINAEIKMLNDGYMKDSLQSRLDLAMQSVHIHLNQLEKSRMYGENLREKAPTPIMKAIAYKNLGLSYLFENYDKSIKNLELSVDLLNETDNVNEQKNIKRSLNFLHIYWNKLDKVEWSNIQLIDDILIYAYCLIKKGDKESASKLLEENKGKLDSDFQLGYHYYYSGLAKNDEKEFYKAVEYFSKSGDQFVRQLPLLALKDLGVDTSLLSALSV